LACRITDKNGPYQYYLPIDLRHGAWVATALLTSKHFERVDVRRRTLIVPMCQSPKIDEALLRTRRIPANDNPAPAETSIKTGPGSRFRATCQTLLIFCCAIAILLL
jgi:hypothetical protein